jgi:hypothetical protein
MSKQTSPFDPNEFAEWLLDSLKEVVRYRVRQTLDRERWMEFFKSKIPNKNQVVHLALKKAFLSNGFVFEDLKQGDATFHLIRKTWRAPAPGKAVRRLLFVPGFGDSPGSWLPLFTLSQRELAQKFDEARFAELSSPPESRMTDFKRDGSTPLNLEREPPPCKCFHRHQINFFDLKRRMAASLAYTFGTKLM